MLLFSIHIEKHAWRSTQEFVLISKWIDQLRNLLEFAAIKHSNMDWSVDSRHNWGRAGKRYPPPIHKVTSNGRPLWAQALRWETELWCLCKFYTVKRRLGMSYSTDFEVFLTCMFKKKGGWWGGGTVKGVLNNAKKTAESVEWDIPY